MVLHLQGEMGASNAARLIEELNTIIKEREPSSLTVDLKEVSYLDDFGVLVLMELRNGMIDRGQFSLENAGGEIEKTLSILHFADLGKRISLGKRKDRQKVLVRLGEAAIRHARDVKNLISFVGSVLMELIHVLVHPRSLRRDDTILAMQNTGVDALPIVGLISFLMGLIMAFMSSAQLQQFGANIYVASLVGLAMVRELGPLMTGIIVAGRSGSAFASEIGTMRISDEIDALFTMGFSPTRFLVIPKMAATVIVLPLLTLFSDLFAIMGGLLVGVFMLHLTASGYITQTIKTLYLFDIFWGFLKSGVFAMLITWIGCLRGFQVRGGAASVGAATTSAVVSSIFMIVVANSIFAVIYHYWG
ncbi:MAG: MlaE family lipid ABC transporter permease subunit [Deltaproteobacteria bacterium]|nr:MlaE family lipid ABC transporter permease subunit [Deltaproteobacteria bacterium]